MKANAINSEYAYQILNKHYDVLRLAERCGISIP